MWDFLFLWALFGGGPSIPVVSDDPSQCVPKPTTPGQRVTQVFVCIFFGPALICLGIAGVMAICGIKHL